MPLPNTVASARRPVAQPTSPCLTRRKPACHSDATFDQPVGRCCRARPGRCASSGVSRPEGDLPKVASTPAPQAGATDACQSIRYRCVQPNILSGFRNVLAASGISRAMALVATGPIEFWLSVFAAWAATFTTRRRLSCSHVAKAAPPSGMSRRHRVSCTVLSTRRDAPCPELDDSAAGAPWSPPADSAWAAPSSGRGVSGGWRAPGGRLCSVAAAGKTERRQPARARQGSAAGLGEVDLPHGLGSSRGG
jgi:hypothetical protein